ncbi:hypothetical protein [Affinirhizobium pseudoryzae]|uniref:hypothetical protein n=1 Tax=Allorhizobium pseudoryzae TaxID=379684 RepID=UPI0013EB8984|nr:hypothetical protein [Allorhizobium pseudoryzae]
MTLHVSAFLAVPFLIVQPALATPQSDPAILEQEWADYRSERRDEAGRITGNEGIVHSEGQGDGLADRVVDGKTLPDQPQSNDFATLQLLGLAYAREQHPRCL